MLDSRETERKRSSEDYQVKGESPAAGVVKHFEKLEKVCKDLGAHLTGYDSLRQVSDSCVSCERELRARMQEGALALKRDELWGQVDQNLDSTRARLVGVPDEVRDGDLKESIESFENKLAEVTQAIDARLVDPLGTDCTRLATDTVQLLRNMNREASEMTVRSKNKVDSLLHEMEGLVRDIRLYIRLADKEAAKPIGQAVGDLEAKEREDQTEAPRVFRQPLKGSPRSKEARTDAADYQP